MTRVLIVEEVRAICEALAAALRVETDLQVVGCAVSLNDEVVAQIAGCDVTLVSASMVSEASVRLVHSLRRLAPEARLVLMGVARSQQAVNACLEAGVPWYVLTDSSLDELLHTIRAADREPAAPSPLVATKALLPVAGPLNLDPCGEPEFCEPQSLTRREREVLSLVQQGLTNQEIAESLVIERGTVKNHVHNILRKLKVNSRRDAAHVSRLAGLWGASDVLFRPMLANHLRPAAAQQEWRGLFGAGLGARQPAQAVVLNR